MHLCGLLPGMRPTELPPLRALELAIRECEDSCQIKPLHDCLEALGSLAATIRTAHREQNGIATLRIHAIRMAGQLLPHILMPDCSPSRGDSPPLPAGIPVRQLSRWYQLAKIPDSVLRAYLQQAADEDAEVSEEGLLRASKAKSLDLHFSSARSEWLTPPEIVAATIRVMGAIDLDPCADVKKNVPAGTHYTEAEDGLSQQWSGRVYMNPPYGHAIKAWVQRLAEYHECGSVGEAIALLPARTDTAWFRRLRPYVRCFVTGRLTFSGHPSPAPFPSAVFYLGSNVQKFLQVFQCLGDCSTTTPDYAP
jgi:phage N-6-adenine-methyltransferase